MPTDATILQSYFREISRRPLLSREQEVDLFRRLRAGEPGVRETIIESNLRLVVRIAQRYQGRGLNLEDLIQEGNIGLLDVIDRFDPELGFRFSTYAAFWIRQAIQVAVRKQGAIIRLPVRKARHLGQMAEVIHEYKALLGRAPTHGELARRLNLKEDQVALLEQIGRTPLSLDTPVDEDGVPLHDQLADTSQEQPVERSMTREMGEKIGQALRQLNERESNVLRLRFGLGGGRPRSLRAVSARVGMSQEGVRRVEQRALAKLKRGEARECLTGLL